MVSGRVFVVAHLSSICNLDVNELLELWSVAYASQGIHHQSRHITLIGTHSDLKKKIQFYFCIL